MEVRGKLCVIYYVAESIYDQFRELNTLQNFYISGKEIIFESKFACIIVSLNSKLLSILSLDIIIIIYYLQLFYET